MRIPKVMKSNTKSVILIAIVATLLNTASSVVVHATQTPLIDGSSNNGSTIDVSASARGDQIIAGVEYGASPAGGGGTNPECEWSESMPRDASATGPGHVVTKRIGSTNYRLFGYTCPARNPATQVFWTPHEDCCECHQYSRCPDPRTQLLQPDFAPSGQRRLWR